jgi:hypothetical protein
MAETFPAALPCVEAGMQRPGIARHLAAVAAWVAQGEGARARPPASGARARHWGAMRVGRARAADAVAPVLRARAAAARTREPCVHR